MLGDLPLDDTSLLVASSEALLQDASPKEALKHGNILVVNTNGTIETAAGPRLERIRNYMNRRLDMTALTRILEDLSRQ